MATHSRYIDKVQAVSDRKLWREGEGGDSRREASRMQVSQQNRAFVSYEI